MSRTRKRESAAVFDAQVPAIPRPGREFKTFTQSEWIAEGKRIFAPLPPAQWVFVCPACGNRQTPEQFIVLNEDPNSAYQQCIGRFRTDRASRLGTRPAADGSKSPCDFAAFGLFKLGHTVTLDADPSKSTVVFPFGEPAAKREGPSEEP